jgi:hypothetical protein
MLIRASNPVAAWIGHNLPMPIESALTQYGSWLERIRKAPQPVTTERGDGL